MKKTTITVIALLMALVLTFAACAGNKTTEETTTNDETTVEAVTGEKAEINLGLLKGPTGMGAAYLLEQNENDTASAKYNVTLAASPDVFQAALINGEIDIAALPTNVAAVLYGKTQGKVKLLAVNTLGVLYVMSNDESVKSIADLKGKTVLSAGQGTTTEYVLDYILDKNGLTVGEDVTVEFASEHAEVVSNAVAGGYDCILLPEPFVTQMKGQDASFAVAIDLTAEWEKLGGGKLTMGCIAVRSDFAEENPDAVAAFLKDYEASVSYVNENTEDAATLIEKFDIAKAAVAEKALPNCNITFMAGTEMKENVSAYLLVLANFNTAAVGGTLPDDTFYVE